MSILSKVLLIIGVFFTNCCIAQSKTNADLKKFENSFFSVLKYSPEQINSCTQLVGLIKIQTGVKGEIEDISISDSIDSLLQREFANSKEKLDVQALRKYLKTDFSTKTNCTYIIPFTLSLNNLPCPLKPSGNNLINNYYKFTGVPLSGDVTLLNSFGRMVKIQQ